ncbi:MAG: VOC family protein [Rhodospirillales bacterium]|nr:VOC family protein [Rhodospirillales bacterium]
MTPNSDTAVTETETKPEPEIYAEPLIHPRTLSHGTLEMVDLKKSKRFYKEFLGLDVVQHRPFALNIRMGGYWVVVCLEVGDKVRALGVRNHWGIDVASRAEVDQAHERALENKEKYGIRKIARIRDEDRAYAFYFQDLDYNWWEIEHVEDDKYNKRFERGDQY